jgi:hypothetical protein
MKLKSILFSVLVLAIATLVICLSPKPYRRHYQIEVTEDKMQVWDGDRYVGELPFYDTANLNPLDNLIISDNE